MSDKTYLSLHYLNTTQGPLINKLSKMPEFLYRLGLAKLFGGRVMILSTIGRKTGVTHRTPVHFFYHEAKYYAISAYGSQSDWYKDILNHPQVTIQNGYDTICATARQLQNEQEWEAVRLYLGLSPSGKRYVEEVDQYLSKLKDGETIQKPSFIAFEPTEEPCPEPIKTDLVYTWPFILLGLAFKISCFYFRRRNR